MSKINKDSKVIGDMFSSISKRYDRVNDVLTAGIYRLWYKKILRISKKSKHQAILDCATGTGNLAILFKQTFPEAEVKGIDFSDGMLEIAKQKTFDSNLEIDYYLGDVLNLPFEEGSFDISSICYGIRNTESTEKCLMEMARVVKSGGKVFVLEFGLPEGILGFFYNVYQHIFIPIIGKIVTSNKEAFTYLTKSVDEYPYDYEFIDIMEKTGCFSNSYFKKFFGGIAYLYVGTVK